MFLELIATFVAGFGAAGLVIALRRMTKGALPGWMTPLAAGVTMMVVAIWSEYTWYDRTVANLPDGLSVAEVNETKQVYRPWTYVAPIVNRFMAVDVAALRAHEARPEQFMTDVYTWGRWQPINRYPVLIDCVGNRRALIPGNAAYAEDGTVAGARWAQVGSDDPVVSTACQRG